MTAHSSADLKPYLSPRPTAPEEAAAEETIWLATKPDVAWKATLEQSEPVYRRIRLSGEVDVVLEWSASLRESVLLNGRIVASELNWGATCVERFQFTVMAGEPAWMTVEVRSRWGWLRPTVTAFRVRLDDRTLYQEGAWDDAAAAGRPPATWFPSKPR